MTDSSLVRCFVALPLPETISVALHDLQQRLQRELDSRALRWVKPEQIHLTLLFLGDVLLTRIDEVQAALKRACEGAGAIDLEVAGTGCFPNARKPKVLWAGVEGEVRQLQALQSRIAQELEPFVERPDSKAFRPHLTLARIKWDDKALASRLAPAIANTKWQPMPWPVSEVLLMESELTREGPIYSVLQRVQLSAGTAKS
jgi:2'-5' RNA ligase